MLKQHSWWLDILFLTLILGTIYSLFLGSRPLFVPDEGRYAEIAREMVATGNYITPHLNAIKYFEKPVLFYWLLSIAIKIAGLNLWSLRSVNALLGVLGCLLTYLTVRKLFDRNTGILAAIILGTNTLYFVMAHMINLDLTVTFFITACLYSFLLGVQKTQKDEHHRNYFLMAAAAAGFAVLTKGLIGIVFPVMIISIWIIILGEYRILKKLLTPLCFFIFLLVAVPWHIFVGLKNPEFFYFYFIEQHILRYTTMDIGHYQPVWFFLPCLLLGFFPWIVFLPQTITTNIRKLLHNRSQHPIELFLILWVILIFSFFSFSKSKLIPYILPVFPPLAILTANYLVKSFDKAKELRFRVSFLFLLLFSFSISYALYLFTLNTELPNAQMTKFLIYCAIAILLFGTIIALIYSYRNKFKATYFAAIVSSLFLLTTLTSLPYIDSRSIQPLALTLKPILQKEDEVIAFNQYYQDLPFYLERRVTILNWHNELTFGMQHQNTLEWMINNDTFWQRWHSNKRVFVVLGKEEYEQLKIKLPHEKFYFWGKTINNALISNKSHEF